MLLWVNMHGMFVLGIGIWGIYLVGDLLEQPSKTWFSTAKVKTLMIGGGLSLAATFLSPSGFHIWGAIASLGSNSYITSKIPEYQSANFHMPETWPYILILLLTILGFARSSTKASWTHALLVAAFAGISLYTSRMIPLFAIVVTPIAAQNPDNARAHHGLGRSFAAQNRLDAGLDEIHAALRTAPEEGEFHYTLASVYERQRRFDEAAAAMLDYVNLLPNKDFSDKAAWAKAQVRFLRSFDGKKPFAMERADEVHIIPFRVVRDKVMVQGRVNGGRAIDFVLDTGAEQDRAVTAGRA